jgi:hypothetical protein
MKNVMKIYVKLEKEKENENKNDIKKKNIFN